MAMWVAALWVSAWVAVPAAVPPQALIFVEEGPEAPALRRAIALELGKAHLTGTATAAEVHCRVMRRELRPKRARSGTDPSEPGAGGPTEARSAVVLELEVRTRNGAPLRRMIPTTPVDLTPALRVAALLVTRAAGARTQRPLPRPDARAAGDTSRAAPDAPRADARAGTGAAATAEAAADPGSAAIDERSGEPSRSERNDATASGVAPGLDVRARGDLDRSGSASSVEDAASARSVRGAGDASGSDAPEVHPGAPNDERAAPVGDDAPDSPRLTTTRAGEIDLDAPAGPRLGDLASLLAPRAPPAVDAEADRAPELRGPSASSDDIDLRAAPQAGDVDTHRAPELRGPGASGDDIDLRAAPQASDVDTHRAPEPRSGSEDEIALRTASAVDLNTNRPLGARARADVAARGAPSSIEVDADRAPEPRGPWAVEGAVGLASSLWPRPVTPTVGPALRGTVTYDRLRFGLEGAWLGLFCCTASGDVEVQATELGLVASAEWVLFRSERFALDVGGGLGLRRVAGTARSTVFAAAGTEEDFDLLQGLGRFSGAARLGLGERVSLSLAAGATVSVGARTVELPATFSGAQAAFDSGAVVPWAVFSVAFHLVRGAPNFF